MPETFVCRSATGIAQTIRAVGHHKLPIDSKCMLLNPPVFCKFLLFNYVNLALLSYINIIIM